MRKIKTNDQVKVIAGKDKGKEGKVLKVLDNPKRGLLVVVEGVNIVKKHQRGNPNMQKPGGIISKEAPLDASNVALVNSKTGKADRVGFKLLEDGTKVRFFKSDNEVVVNG